MNDFTKEELKIINGALNQLYDLCEEKLIDKVQSMIDSYCEHECEHAWVVARDEPIGIDECTNRFFICVKCYEVDR